MLLGLVYDQGWHKHIHFIPTQTSPHKRNIVFCKIETTRENTRTQWLISTTLYVFLYNAKIWDNGQRCFRFSLWPKEMHILFKVSAIIVNHFTNGHCNVIAIRCNYFPENLIIANCS